MVGESPGIGRSTSSPQDRGVDRDEPRPWRPRAREPNPLAPKGETTTLKRGLWVPRQLEEERPQDGVLASTEGGAATQLEVTFGQAGANTIKHGCAPASGDLGSAWVMKIMDEDRTA